MNVINSKEFASNQDKYFDIAKNENVCIKRGNGMFHLTYQPAKTQFSTQTILAPDDNLRSAITAEELLKRVHKDIHNKFASRI
jgi:hypothetical protein